MHLKQLKLAGFKSFVDLTIVPFSSQLIAVVGPNGCGKSNIIDAIRWVMGESSAKNLRGESMVDVIFNGSSTRKSVGQASVELVFDNSMGRLLGPYASYQEIAVKRLLTRDGQSFYYLNGSRCRRRDITDIFLGTGAGSRSYSIIGQNTISRIVEAHPDDLRAYLEEAAGVSKYKDRRRETMQRIAQTRENLSRVADIRGELGQQLKRLERQAAAAERYKSLKQEGRLCKAEILALKRRMVMIEQEQVISSLNRLGLDQEEQRSRLTGHKTEEIYVRDLLERYRDDFQQTQRQFYQLGTEIARLEEMLLQQKREQQRLGVEKEQITLELQTAEEQLQQDQTMLATCESDLLVSSANVLSLKEDLHQRQAMVSDLTSKKTSLDQQWKVIQSQLNQKQRETQLETLRLQHMAEQEQTLQISLEKNQQEQANMSVDVLQEALAASTYELEKLTQQTQKDAQGHQQVVAKGRLLRDELTMIEQQLHQSQDRVQKIATEAAALQAMQYAALRHAKKNQTETDKWAQTPRLAELMSVSPDWFRACEFVFGDALQAIIIDDINALTSDLPDINGSAALFVESRKYPNKALPYPRLIDNITGVLPAGPPDIEYIFAAETLAQALTWLPNLSSAQSVVTKDGYWLGSGWVKVSGLNSEDASGILARQQELLQLKNALVVAKDHLSLLQSQRDKQHADWVANGAEQAALQKNLVDSQENLRSFQLDYDKKHHVLEQAKRRLVVLAEEYDELQLSLEETSLQKITSDGVHQRATEVVLSQEQALQDIIAVTTLAEEHLATARRTAEEVQTLLHQAQLNSHKDTLKAQQLKDNIRREQGQIDGCRARLTKLELSYQKVNQPDEQHLSSLQEKIAMHHQRELELSAQQQKVEEATQQLQQIEQIIKHEEQQASCLQELLQQDQLKEQGLSIRLTSLDDSLMELGADVVSILQSIPEHVTIEMQEEHLKHIDEKIQRLGAINLMAIDEYKTELDRKTHLDTQYDDLTDALATLDDAIAKMDKETLLRLKETFEQVNRSFQALFPRLFGGGRAFLELTCDNLLEAGIVVMAQPPGKRNSTIHLLSGGEKAMTAVALVFAIFQLNPSPFCMLDEVDAPLDDLNVQRFCDVVKEMSSLVQFLFITHNKVTMEMADHLIGVTMREPGVSRLVTVNVEQALSILEE
jgi:chromosome segregation protein